MTKTKKITPMKVAVVGAGKQNNGIGRYISKYFHLNGSCVVAVLGTTTHSSRSAALDLSCFGIEAAAYTSFETMILREDPDAIVIASPQETHLHFLHESIEAGLHLFCEKPFVWPLDQEVSVLVEELLDRAARKGLVVCMNSQWPFCLPWYEELCGPLRPEDITGFSMYTQPPGTGLFMVPDAAPHALSMLYQVLGPGKVGGVTMHPGSREAELCFTYHAGSGECGVSLKLVHNPRQPRDFRFGFNGRIVTRYIEPQSYALQLCRGDSQCSPVDPLNLSVRDFLSALTDGGPPLIGPRHILDTTVMLRDLYHQCELFWRRSDAAPARHAT